MSFRADSLSGYETPPEDIEELEPSSTAVRFSSAAKETAPEVDTDGSGSSGGDVETDLPSEKHARRSSVTSSVSKFRSKFKKAKLGKGLLARIFRKWPRCYACTCGIIAPLWILVLISMLFGRFLGELEYKNEIAANNAALRDSALAVMYNDAIDELMGDLPSTCLTLYQNKTERERLPNAFKTIYTREVSFNTFVVNRRDNLTDANSTTNMTDFISFMENCGRVALDTKEIVRERHFGNVAAAPVTDPSLSFNWARCVNRTHPHTFNHIFTPTTQDVIDARPETQSNFYTAAWHEHRQELENFYFETFEVGNTSSSRLTAFEIAVEVATAEEHCAVNVAAGAWFWFTVMTTVGYGNQAPATTGGRAMIYSLGFLSILLFAFILANTGTIITHLVSDFLHRVHRENFCSVKSFMILFWGFLWIAWMVFLSFHVYTWKRIRLEEELSVSDSIWFSFISTTTVGLGDIYPNPEVLFFSDLLFYSLTFLIGFVLLSTFLAELSQFLAMFLPEPGETLERQLYFVGYFHFKGCLDFSKKSESLELSELAEMSEAYSSHGRQSAETL